MSKTRMVLLTIAGSIVGLLVGSGLVIGLTVVIYLLNQPEPGQESWAGFVAFFIGVIGVLIIGVPMGAAAGATIVRKLLRQETSFWGALGGTAVGAFVGLLLVPTLFGIPIGLLLTIAGAVIGSGSLSEERESAPVSPYSQKRLPGEHLCPNCHCWLADSTKTCRCCGADQG